VGFFSRLGDIISANLNDLLDRMENPEKMLKQLLGEMERAVQQGKEALVEAITAERRLEKEIGHYKARAAEWEAKAVEAVKKGRDDLARKALELQTESEDILSALEGELAAAQKNTDAARTQLRGLQAKYQEAKRKQASLAARNVSAEIQTKAARGGGRGKKAGASAFDEFEKIEDKITLKETKAQARAEVASAERSVEEEFAALAGPGKVDQRLSALKEKLKKHGT
jgi:phage shock protein A